MSNHSLSASLMNLEENVKGCVSVVSSIDDWYKNDKLTIRKMVPVCHDPGAFVPPEVHEDGLSVDHGVDGADHALRK